MSGNEDTEARRTQRQPYTSKHTIPTVQEYRQQKDEQRERLAPQNGYDSSEHYGRTDEAKDRASNYWANHHGDQSHDNATTNGENNGSAGALKSGQGSKEAAGHDEIDSKKKGGGPQGDRAQYQGMADTSQVQAVQDPKAKRKAMKKRTPERAEREVTDPITHLPVTIQDFTEADLENLQDDSEEDGTTSIKSIGKRGRSGTGNTLDQATEKNNSIHQGMMKVFPPPDYDLAQRELAGVHMQMYTLGLSVVAVVSVAISALWFSIIEPHPWNKNEFVRGVSALTVTALGVAIVSATIYTAQDIGQKKVKEVWDDAVWESERKAGKAAAKNEDPESTQWLNMMLGSIWPLVNPDLFTSLADMLEDVMQASLPKMVRMVAVQDIGQGSESIRILGIKWLPRAAAKKSVSAQGRLEDAPDSKPARDPVKISEGGSKDASQDANQRPSQTEDENPQGQDNGVAAGMEAEEGDFFNLEIAFAYKTSRSRRKARDRAKNMHLYLAFYLPGNIKLPVWVELRGLVGTLRVRLQTSPDPPFVGLCTITLLGQPKVDISCVPLVKKGLNLMDVPLISNFVQSAVDAAMSEYVAPKSQTIDLKSMLAGEDYKTETTARGILVIRIKRAYDFKAGDTGIPLIKKGGSDPYVSVGWAKFGKPLWSTRVLIAEMNPYWEEQTHMLVGPEELDAEESLRVQLWDSDRTSADDDLGRIELNLKQLMKADDTNGKMHDRTDEFHALKEGESMPGRLEWSVGYFSKTRLQDVAVKEWSKSQPAESPKTVAQLKKQVYEDAADKLSQTARDETGEIKQQQVADFHAKSQDIINNSVPPSDYPSGILSIQLHQIVGLEYQSLNKDRKDDDADDLEEDDEEGADALPSSYCNVIINHTKVYKTRTKPKNSQPFFNAATERFVRDWRTTSVLISVRDARVHEDHALLGIVHLPVAEIFRRKKCSRFTGYYPLAGGMGCGRLRISIVYRSLQLQLPPSLHGWDYGTLQIAPEVSCSSETPENLQGYRLKFRTKLGKGRMGAKKHDGSYGDWATGDGKPMRLAVRQRYATQLVVEFRSSGSLFGSKVPAFAILWLSSIPDEEEQDLTLPIFDGDLKRATANQLPESEMGKKVGELKLKVTFWRGLGQAHRRLAARDPTVGEVMEVLQTTHDMHDQEDIIGAEGWRGADDGDHGSDDSSDDEDTYDDSAHVSRFSHDGPSTSRHADVEEGGSHRRGSTDSKRHSGSSFIDDIKNYRRNKDQLHRQGRGAMQWKAPRTLAWMKHKAEHATEKVRDLAHHHERESVVETEV